jgi:hypothetical protein
MHPETGLQQLVRSTGTMLVQCRFIVVLLTIFLFSTFAAYASLTLISESIEKRAAIAFSVGIFLKPGTFPEKAAIERARAIRGVRGITLMEPSAAPGVITKYWGHSAAVLTQGVPMDRFPFTIVLHLEREYFTRADEVIKHVADEISGVQEIRWPIEGHKNVVTTLKRLNTAQTQLGILLFFVLIAGCLSIVRVAAKVRPVVCCQYALAGTLSGAVASILMMQTINLLSSTTGYELSLDYKLYLGMIAAGLLSGAIGDISQIAQNRRWLKRKKDNADADKVPMEALP